MPSSPAFLMICRAGALLRPAGWNGRYRTLFSALSSRLCLTPRLLIRPKLVPPLTPWFLLHTLGGYVHIFGHVHTRRACRGSNLFLLPTSYLLPLTSLTRDQARRSTTGVVPFAASMSARYQSCPSFALQPAPPSSPC